MFYYVCRVCKAEEYHKTAKDRRCKACNGLLRLFGYKPQESKPKNATAALIHQQNLKEITKL